MTNLRGYTELSVYETEVSTLDRILKSTGIKQIDTYTSGRFYCFVFPVHVAERLSSALTESSVEHFISYPLEGSIPEEINGNS